MATVSQIKLQTSSPVKYTNGEAVLPPVVVSTPNTTLIISAGAQAEGTDLGVIKVEGGKFVLDMDDFEPDFGTF